MLSRNTLLYGTSEAPAPLLGLNAGPLSLYFQNGDLRYITCAGREVLRRAYAAVRDPNWGTVPGKLSQLKIDSRRDRFHIRYESDHNREPIHFRWQAEITGRPDGQITFSMEGKALTTFKRNRIGFCVHHPLNGFAGRECEVETTQGWRKDRVPAEIAPNQPFLGMKAVRHEIAPGCQAEVRFVGDLFEMEDHRNWTDGNFKTYGTPLSLPFPVEVVAGTVIQQSVVIQLVGRAPKLVSLPAKAPVTIAAQGEARSLPEIGLAAASSRWAPAAGQLNRLKALRLSHLRAEAATLDQPAVELSALDLPLEMTILLGAEPRRQLEQAAAMVKDLKLNVRRWIVYEEKAIVTTTDAVKLARSVLPTDVIVGRTRANFAEVNRNRPAAGSFDGVSFTINPQVHAFDNLSLAENSAAQRDVVMSARAFCGTMPIYISPVTFKQQFNAAATGAEAPAPPGVLPTRVDPRQMSLFGAGWTLASIKNLAEAGAAAITYYETAGWKGVMETTAGSALPEKFPSIAGSVFPIWHVLADVGEFRGGQVLPCVSSRPLDIECLILKLSGRSRLIVANLSTERQAVELPVSLLGAMPSMRILDASNAESAMTKPEEFRAPRSMPGAASSGGVSRRAMIGGVLAALTPRNGVVSLSLDACAIARIDF